MERNIIETRRKTEVKLILILDLTLTSKWQNKDWRRNFYFYFISWPGTGFSPHWFYLLPRQRRRQYTYSKAQFAFVQFVNGFKGGLIRAKTSKYCSCFSNVIMLQVWCIQLLHSSKYRLHNNIITAVSPGACIQLYFTQLIENVLCEYFCASLYSISPWKSERRIGSD